MGQLKSKVDRQLFDSKNSSPSSQNASQSAVNNASFTNLNTTTADDNISPGLARLRNTPGKLFSAGRSHVVLLWTASRPVSITTVPSRQCRGCSKKYTCNGVIFQISQSIYFQQRHHTCLYNRTCFSQHPIFCKKNHRKRQADKFVKILIYSEFQTI